jgi:hypothetical protein
MMLMMIIIIIIIFRKQKNSECSTRVTNDRLMTILCHEQGETSTRSILSHAFATFDDVSDEIHWT